MSLIPQTILPPANPLGRVRKGESGDDIVLIEQNWWLFLYGLAQQVLGGGTSSGLPATALIELGNLEGDAQDADAIALRQPVSNLGVQLWGMGETEVDAFALRSPLAQALILAQDRVLPDPVPMAQPVQAITPGASPYTYTLPFSGSVAVTGGTVSAIAIVRQGTSIATGVTTGVIPASRGDGIKVTYTGTPTMTFLPT
jgi:hypothetical protein